MILADTAGKESSSYPSILELVLGPVQQCPELQNPAHLAWSARDPAHPTLSGEEKGKSIWIEDVLSSKFSHSICTCKCYQNNMTETTSQAKFFNYAQKPPELKNTFSEVT